MPLCQPRSDRRGVGADLPQILADMDQPSVDGINSWYASKAVAERGLKVVVSGVGGDDHEVRLARDQDDMRAAQRLRYRVFVEELGGDGAQVDAVVHVHPPHATALSICDGSLTSHFTASSPGSSTGVEEESSGVRSLTRSSVPAGM